MIGLRWINNLAGAESTLSHILPDTMGSDVDFDDKEEMQAQHLMDETPDEKRMHAAEQDH